MKPRDIALRGRAIALLAQAQVIEVAAAAACKLLRQFLDGEVELVSGNRNQRDLFEAVLKCVQSTLNLGVVQSAEIVRQAFINKAMAAEPREPAKVLRFKNRRTRYRQHNIVDY